jgi:hypothetical protein
MHADTVFTTVAKVRNARVLPLIARDLHVTKAFWTSKFIGNVSVVASMFGHVGTVLDIRYVRRLLFT